MTVRVGRLAALVCLLGVLALRAVADTSVAVEERLRRDITYLASNECEGRGVSTEGINRAADYIVTEFKKAGLQPPAAHPNYFQPFTMAGDTQPGSGHQVVLRGPLGQEIELRQETHFQPVGLSNKGKLTAPLVFVGYGVSADSQNYDDYRGVEVAGKIVIMLRKTPRADNPLVPFDGQQRDFHAGLETKVIKADLNKAAAVLFVNDADTARNGDALMPFAYTAQSGSPAKVPVLHVRRSVVETLVQSSLGRTLRDLEQDINRTAQPRSGALTGWTAALTVNVDRKVLHVKNVIGVAPGSGKLADETVVVGAHYDHLGYGDRRFSLFRSEKPVIHHGADDNGSGTTALLELARRYGGPSQGDRRRLVFMAFSAEEMGLFGSAYYCKNPLFPLDKTVAMVNLDMVGRLRPDPMTNRDRLYVEGSGTAKHFNDLLDGLAKKHEFSMSKTRGGNGPSDHASFYTAKIPVVFYWTGNHPDYHRPSDTADKINIAGMRKIVTLAQDTITHLATTAPRPEYVFIAPAKPLSGVRGGGPRLGIVPNYADENDGLLLDGVSEGGPAAKGGLKEGDRIISLAGQPVRNVNTYMVLMAGRKKGETIEVIVMRKNDKVTLKVVLE